MSDDFIMLDSGQTGHPLAGSVRVHMHAMHLATFGHARFTICHPHDWGADGFDAASSTVEMVWSVSLPLVRSTSFDDALGLLS